MATGNREWMDRAACRDRADLDWFDLDCTLQAAVNVCLACTVADDCYEYARKHKLDEGVWGGVWGYHLTGHRPGEGGTHEPW